MKTDIIIHQFNQRISRKLKTVESMKTEEIVEDAKFVQANRNEEKKWMESYEICDV